MFVVVLVSFFFVDNVGCLFRCINLITLSALLTIFIKWLVCNILDLNKLSLVEVRTVGWHPI